MQIMVKFLCGNECSTCDLYLHLNDRFLLGKGLDNFRRFPGAERLYDRSLDTLQH